MTQSPTIIEVAIPLRLEQGYSYLLPHLPADGVVTGLRVLVPFGRRTVTGYVLGIAAGPPSGELKEIREVLDREPLFTGQDLEFYRWVASYYHYPLGEVIRTALPGGLTMTGRSKTVVAADGSVLTEEVLSTVTRCKEERHYSATGKEPLPSLKGRAVDLLELIRASQEISATILRSRFGACSPQLNRLEELGLVKWVSREVYRDPFRKEVVERDAPCKLNQEQALALSLLVTVVKKGGFSPFLLHGVTGSGKTEVYLQAIVHVLELGKTGLVLVPEIALTPQLVGRFRRRLGCGIAVLHSGLSAGERYDEWRRIRRGEAQVVIGARSAIFAPLDNIGIIVVDEEHEGSYKQADGLRYNARDLALVLGKQRSAVVILGSATPLVTSVYAARSGKLTDLPLTCRVNDRAMPCTTLLDQRGMKGLTLLPELAAALEENLANGGQSLLFLNRRGFATWLVCRDCGTALTCPSCSVTLTYHQQKKSHICHYCDYTIPAPTLCPACDGGEIGLLGIGTEKLEEEMAALFPHARVARMDRDTTSGKGGHERVLVRLERGEIDILIGTQMIAKGHDFPGVTLVGVISADTTLNLPDFRGSERAFQLVSQVLGRAGRGELPGRVFVQTLNPEHFALMTAAAHDYEGFYREELAQREDAGYPPFSYLAALHFSSTSSKEVEAEADRAAKTLRSLKQQLRLRVEILGPAPAPLTRIRGRYRWQLLLKSVQRNGLHKLLSHFRNSHKPAAIVRVAIDIDPLELL
jgi:primosomal protein N' (replication factor Y)